MHLSTPKEVSPTASTSQVRFAACSKPCPPLTDYRTAHTLGSPHPCPFATAPVAPRNSFPCASASTPASIDASSSRRRPACFIRSEDGSRARRRAGAPGAKRELVGAVRRREQRYANSTVAQAQAGKRAWLTVLRVCQLQLLFIFTFTC